VFAAKYIGELEGIDVKKVAVVYNDNPAGTVAFNVLTKPILEQTGLQDVAELRVNNGVIEIRPVKTNPREGWAMDSQRIAMEKDDSLVWPEFGNADDKDLKW